MKGAPPHAPVVVITGASSGIGRATARRYARHGARLVLASRSRAALETVAAECRELGAQAVAVPTDVSHEGEVRSLAAAAVLEFGRIDVWVGNAGVFAYGAFEHLPPTVFRQVLETNLMGQVHGARAVLPYLRRQGSGTLVMVGSLYSRVGSPIISPYVTSKWGLLGFAECLRQELRGSGIRVRVVLPGTVDTPIYQHAANVTTRHVRPLPPAASPERVARAIERAPRRRRFSAYVGRVQKSTVVVHDLAPAAYDAASSLMVERVELHGEGAEVTVGTVLEAPAAASPVTGGWRSRGVRLLWAAAAAAALSTLLVRRRPPAAG
ncbi:MULTISPECIES: SDR family NAD(P)-dependent oxidoreductase [Microbacterium]|uniref:SDR family NAD(P)-dependent oxidoreductase n=1 Tax=Microbacterium TaxID=33882 RepID=UPI000D64D228|nr:MULTISPECIES: SDR family NAD(P)-dependent oxidoreductase [Microbacterium]